MPSSGRSTFDEIVRISFGNGYKASCLKRDDEIIETFLHKDNEAIEAFWK